jgi:Spy/CpxP family protein refolding chaperone
MRLFSLAGLLLLAVPFLRAADAPVGPSPGDQPKHERGERRGPGVMMEHAAKELGLTADQEVKWKEIGQQEHAATKPIMDDQSLSKEDRRAKLKELNKTYADQRRAVLTADQAKKFDEMRAKRPERGPKGERGPKKD